MRFHITLDKVAKQKHSYIIGRVSFTYNSDIPIQAANKFGKALYKDFNRLGDDGVFEEIVTIGSEKFKITAHRFDYDVEIMEV